jgi:hypothetical protein
MLQKYHPLLLKMAFDNPIIWTIILNWKYLIDIETFKNVVCIVLFEAQDCFVIDLVEVIKLTWA